MQRLYASRECTLKLARPASAAALDQIERKYGFGLPADLRDAFLATNGIPHDKPFFARPGFLTSYGFLSTTSALKEREGMRKRAPSYRSYVETTPRSVRIASGWYSDGWLPFAEFGGGSLLLILDFAPTARGSAGQIIAYTHDPDEISYVAPSFGRFLAMSLKTAQADPEEFLRLF